MLLSTLILREMLVLAMPDCLKIDLDEVKDV